MVRVAAFVVILLGGGLAFEEITGDELGIKRTMRSVGDFFGVHYTGGGSSNAFGGLGSVAGN